MYDIIIVGKGLIGCAAAKYISRTNLKMAIIGPDEPKDYSNAEIFASHYDSGRVLRQLGKNSAMANINLIALKEYPALEEESGIDFHQQNGCLYVNPYGVDDYLENAEERAISHCIKVNRYRDSKSIHQDFAFLNFPKESQGVFESGPSGHVNPRQLINAQLKIVQKNGGDIIQDIVINVSYKKDYVLVETSNSHIYRANKIIFALGAFTNHFNLLKRKLDLILKSETVILAQLEIDEVKRLSHMPSLLFEVNTPFIEGIYATQPIKYPDGNFYLKMGANTPNDIYFNSDLSEIKNWFANGNSDVNIPVLKEYLQQIVPDFKINRVLSKRCILTRTKHPLGNPYIDIIKENQAFLAIGNGWSGGNSDGIGNIIANLAIEGKYPLGISGKDFAPVYIN